MRFSLSRVATAIVVGLLVAACASSASPAPVTTPPPTSSPPVTTSRPTSSPPVTTPPPTSSPPVVGPTITAVAAGRTHGCALTIGGGVKCWGYNRNGELGDGTMNTRLFAAGVSGLASGVSAIAVGGRHTCALTSVGGVKCWGVYDSDQLTGRRTMSLVPEDVAGLTTGVMAIAAGSLHTCALTSGGGVKCWGLNLFGQLGSATMTESRFLVDVSGLASGVSAISADNLHTCALTSGGGVKCWGNNDRGELGNGSTTDSGAPVDVTGLESGAIAVTAGENHTCALTIVGGVKCWGANGSGGLGNASTTNSSTPVDVSGLTSGVTAIAATCAVTSVGGVKCWGENAFGALGDGTRTSSSVPVDVDFTVHPTIALRSSEPAGTIARGTTVTFTATVRPPGPAGTYPTVRFVVYRLDGDVWRSAASRDVAADASGQATLTWGFATAGKRYVRAKVLPNATYSKSTWSMPVHYTVR